MRAVTIDSDLATLFTFTPRKPPICHNPDTWGSGVLLNNFPQRRYLYTL